MSDMENRAPYEILFQIFPWETKVLYNLGKLRMAMVTNKINKTKQKSSVSQTDRVYFLFILLTHHRLAGRITHFYHSGTQDDKDLYKY